MRNERELSSTDPSLISISCYLLYIDSLQVRAQATASTRELTEYCMPNRARKNVENVATFVQSTSEQSISLIPPPRIFSLIHIKCEYQCSKARVERF